MAAFVTGGRARIRFLTCGFDAPAVIVIPDVRGRSLDEWETRRRPRSASSVSATRRWPVRRHPSGQHHDEATLFAVSCYTAPLAPDRGPRRKQSICTHLSGRDRPGCRWGPGSVRAAPEGASCL